MLALTSANGKKEARELSSTGLNRDDDPNLETTVGEEAPTEEVYTN
jgi:hypothetical protein